MYFLIPILSTQPTTLLVVNVPTTVRVELFALVNFAFPVYGCNDVVLLSHNIVKR